MSAKSPASSLATALLFLTGGCTVVAITPPPHITAALSPPTHHYLTSLTQHPCTPAPLHPYTPTLPPPRRCHQPCVPVPGRGAGGRGLPGVRSHLAGSRSLRVACAAGDQGAHAGGGAGGWEKGRDGAILVVGVKGSGKGKGGAQAASQPTWPPRLGLSLSAPHMLCSCVWLTLIHNGLLTLRPAPPWLAGPGEQDAFWPGGHGLTRLPPCASESAGWTESVGWTEIGSELATGLQR